MITKSDQLQPLLSIIVPNYNNAKFFCDCIESILTQTFKNYEIIICDDSSTDNSVELIQQYAEKYSYIRVIYHKKNIGISMNRHSGILLARGLYFTTLDSDDVYFDDMKLEKEMGIVTFYKEKKNQIVCAFSKVASLDKDLNYIRDQWPEDKIKEGYIFNEILSRSAMIPRDYVVATEAYFTAGQYDRQFNLYEDWDLKIRIAKRCDFYFTGIYGTGYRKHGKGLSNISTPKNINALGKVFDKNFHLVVNNDKARIKEIFVLYIQQMRLTYTHSLKKEFRTYNLAQKIIHVSTFIEILYNNYLLSVKR